MINIIPLAGAAVANGAQVARRMRYCRELIGPFPQQQEFPSLTEAKKYASCLETLYPSFSHNEMLAWEIALFVCLLVVPALVTYFFIRYDAMEDTLWGNVLMGILVGELVGMALLAIGLLLVFLFL